MKTIQPNSESKNNGSQSEKSPSLITVNIFFAVAAVLFGWIILFSFREVRKTRLWFLYYGLILLLFIIGTPHYTTPFYMAGELFVMGTVPFAINNPIPVVGYLALVIHIIAWVHVVFTQSTQMAASQKSKS